MKNGFCLCLVCEGRECRETAAYFADKVASIDVIGMEKVPFERVLGTDIGLALQKFHETKGSVKFHMTRVVSEFKVCWVLISSLF